MAKIFYSMSGEGRGHATRVRAVVEQLRPHHELVLFAPGDAFDLLDPIYAGTEVRVERIPCLRFCYTSKRLNPFTTAQTAMGYLFRLPRLVRRLKRVIQAERPDLVITDFEPALPRAAAKAGVPFLSLDHQHFLVYSDLSELSWHLRSHAALWGSIVQWYYRGQRESVVSSFFEAPLKAGIKDRVTQIGVLLQPEILAAETGNEGHLLVYLRKFASPTLLNTLKRIGRPVHVYGLGNLPRDGHLRFFPVDQRRFLEDLAHCEALISTAGNQVVGESLYLGKPVFALPEAQNHEQAINAHFLAKSGAGVVGDWDRVEHADLKRFLDQLGKYREHIDTDWLNGNPAALAAIDRCLTGEPDPCPAKSAKQFSDRGACPV